ncbi:MAG TPA: chromate efflux transporter [Candidatus Eisenbacteria bacterium]|nr:chromate efflux transporter [Candidatus Eisenbacteria bacterium]
MSDPSAPRGLRSEIAWVFLKLGTIGFGGPAAHIALMEDEVVRRRRWLSRQDFLDLLAATHMIPGPNSTEMAIHLGLRRGGASGLLIAGICFILPAALIVTAMAWSYVRFGSYPVAKGALLAIQPVIAVIVVQAVWSLGREAVRTRGLAILAVAALISYALGAHELVVIGVAGLFAAILGVGGGTRETAPALGLLPSAGPASPSGPSGPSDPSGPALLAAAVAPAAAAAVPVTTWGLFLVFLKTGSVLFGSGYVLVAFLRADLVERWRWLSESQLLDAVAVGQFTPGPLSATATFIGYLLAGWPGAAAATLGMFLPSFVLVALSGPLVPRLRRSRAAGAVLDGLVIGSLAVMAVVSFLLARSAITDWISALVAVVAALLLLRFRVNAAWLVLGAGALGAALGMR